MKRILREVMSDWLQSAEMSQQVNQMIALKDHKGWEAFVQFMWFVKVQMRNTPFSKQFLQLSDENKNSLLQTYQWMDEFINFMMNPLESAEQTMKIKRHNLKAAHRAGGELKRRTAKPAQKTKG